MEMTLVKSLHKAFRTTVQQTDCSTAQLYYQTVYPFIPTIQQFGLSTSPAQHGAFVHSIIVKAFDTTVQQIDCSTAELCYQPFDCLVFTHSTVPLFNNLALSTVKQ
jgi:hypothetical protein